MTYQVGATNYPNCHRYIPCTATLNMLLWSHNKRRNTLIDSFRARWGASGAL